VGVGEHVRVAIGAAEKQRNHLAGPKVLPGDLDVAMWGTGGHLYRAFDTQDLLDGGGPEVGILV
jgi:hypothetical protein